LNTKAKAVIDPPDIWKFILLIAFALVFK
jgi:hypothetical protein